ncbi:fungal specific transcription factor, putative [Talaromyces stipitatus ATCC 10500]|uniref:Fungal specific transcription factor, putative n=1 Tax=Talaromyces stipitatus (strain ATCC 10500 / CBS 375.48 / QM 6759 / NRRL 1006) TaxID=441959 RepID=B8M826_TALSN|nr:fungal specific transcription factor, putative [Talaromyces stipitatus ATCC 10500]EED19988.1 fungal specific transcription factor, putative [Talaromyces stipitatus ATCC 10500]
MVRGMALPRVHRLQVPILVDAETNLSYPVMLADAENHDATAKSLVHSARVEAKYSSAQSQPRRPDMHDRLVQLESLVKSLITNSHTKKSSAGASSDPSPRSGTGGDTLETPTDGRSECGSMHISSSGYRYVGEDHWASILDRIADLKDHVDWEEQQKLVANPENSAYEEWAGDSFNIPIRRPKSGGYALLLYGVGRPVSRDQILTALPPKASVDRYISRYFNYLDLVSSFSEAPGLDNEHKSLQIDLYREKVVQCLLLGNYTNCGPYVLETIINYVYAEFCVHRDAHKDIWFLLALEVNLAMRMGYHRDPSHFPGISPFAGEMRCRVWGIVKMGDILISNQIGMPRMICDWKWDTAEPRNLNDTDFDEDTAELPPSRHENEHTISLGPIARGRILKALGKVTDLTDSIKQPTYAEVMRVDGILEEAARSIPQPLRMKPIAASVTDSPQIIMSRLFLGHLFYRGKIILHRRFLHMHSPSQDNDSFVYSRKACIEAALGTLEIQSVLDEETCPEGQLHTVRFQVTSIMNHQFLTATMILCFMLYSGQTQGRDDEIRTALQRSRSIWIRRSSFSKEAQKAAETVSIVLTKAGGYPDTCTNNWMTEIGAMSNNLDEGYDNSFMVSFNGSEMFTGSTCMIIILVMTWRPS